MTLWPIANGEPGKPAKIIVCCRKPNGNMLRVQAAEHLSGGAHQQVQVMHIVLIVKAITALANLPKLAPINPMRLVSTILPVISTSGCMIVIIVVIRMPPPMDQSGKGVTVIFALSVAVLMPVRRVLCAQKTAKNSKADVGITMWVFE